MKKTVFLLIFIFLIQLPVHAQHTKELAGTWYGKIRAYQFRQDGTAQCYTKRKITNYQQKLVINKNLDYTYIEYYRGDTIRTEGRVALDNDTLKFLITQMNQQNPYNNFQSSYFLYILNNLEMVYSNFPVKKIIKEEDDENKIFQKVEVNAEYSLGNNEFMKSLYTSLTKLVISKDSVKINSYRVKIDSLGNMDLATLESVHADPEYFNAIKQGLLNLRNNFKPAIQNGRAVNGYMTFQITY